VQRFTSSNMTED